jgi:arylsulfatase
VVNIKNKSHAVTADLSVPEGGARGVVISQGGAFGGWTLYFHEGRLAYCYNLFGLQQFKVYSDQPVPAGDHQVRMEFGYDGGGLGKGGTADLYVDGAQVGSGRVEGTVPMLFSGDETADVGSDTATPVSDDYAPGTSTFVGRIHRVQIDIGKDAEDNDHLITPEERMRIATTRQ